MESLTKDKLEGIIKGVVGEQFAEMRKENEAKNTEFIEKVFARLAPAEAKPEPTEKGFHAAAFIMALAGGQGDPVKAKAFAEANFTNDGGIGERVSKALSTTPGSAGGVFVPADWMDEVLGLLRNKSAVRQMGARTVPMPNGNITMTKQTASSIAEYVGENMGQKASQPAFGTMSLVFKKLRVTVPLSNELIAFSKPNALEMVRDDIVSAMRLKEDSAFLRGLGTQFSPRGLRYWTPAANIIPANVTVNLANVTADLAKPILQLEYANVAFSRPGWIMNPRTAAYLMTVRDANGNFAFRGEMASRPGINGTLWGFPYVTTNQVPRTLGAGTNESEIYFADFADVIIGESSDVQVDVSKEAAYLDESGNLVSAFSNDQTIVRAIARHDLGVRYDESLTVLTGVLWTA